MFSSIDKFIALALGTVFVYLLVKNDRGTSVIFSGLTNLTTGTFKTLQGR